MAKSVRFYGSKFQVGTVKGPNVGVTGVTKANPAVFTSAAHSLAIGDVVEVAAIAGMPEFKPGAYVVGTVPTTTTFTLFGLDTTAYATVGTTSTINRWTMADFCEGKNVQGDRAETPETETTGMCDDEATFEQGTRQPATFAIDGNFLPQDTLQKKMDDYAVSGETVAVRILFAAPATNGGMVSTVTVRKVSFSGQLNGVWSTSVSMKCNSALRRYLPV